MSILRIPFAAMNLVQLISSFVYFLFKKNDGGPVQAEGWGPLMQAPMSGYSLHEFWGARWHQIFRHRFLVTGGYPFQYILTTIVHYLPIPMSKKGRAGLAKGLGDAGLVFGSFTASSYMHNYAYAPKLDPATGLVPNATGQVGSVTIWFFIAQAFALAFERLWKIVTGRRVSGFFGKAWLWVWIIFTSQFLCKFLSLYIPPYLASAESLIDMPLTSCVTIFSSTFLGDSWYSLGFQTGLIIPSSLSPTEQFLIPFIKQFL